MDLGQPLPGNFIYANTQMNTSIPLRVKKHISAQTNSL